MNILRLDMPRVLRILRILGSLSSTWPPDPKAGSRELLLREIMWSIAVLNALGTLIPLALNVYYYENGIINLMKTLSELTALTEVFFNLVLCKMGRTKLQKLVGKIEDFLVSANEEEKMILGKYVDRYSGFSAFVSISYLSAAITFSCGPLLMATHLPAEAWYPFSIDTPIRIFIIYVLQVFAIFQTAFGLTVDLMIAVLFSYSTARIEMLCLELENAKNNVEMKLCIKKHQEIIGFVDDTQDAVVYLICKTNITMACTVICGGIPLVYNQPLTVMAQFTCMVVGGCERLYVTAWPADDLREISQHIALATYKARFIRKSSVSSNLCFLIQRSQKPLDIRMGSFFPTLSLAYYTHFLKTISSYFVSMRAVIDN